MATLFTNIAAIRGRLSSITNLFNAVLSYIFRDCLQVQVENGFPVMKNLSMILLFMSVVFQINVIIFFRLYTNPTMSPVSNHLRLSLVSAFAGIALFSALALYLRRRKRKKASLYHEIYVEEKADKYTECNRPNSVDTASIGSLRRRSPKVLDVNGGNR